MLFALWDKPAQPSFREHALQLLEICSGEKCGLTFKYSSDGQMYLLWIIFMAYQHFSKSSLF